MSTWIFWGAAIWFSFWLTWLGRQLSDVSAQLNRMEASLEELKKR